MNFISSPEILLQSLLAGDHSKIPSLKQGDFSAA
jgi:hypothetical protein